MQPKMMLAAALMLLSMGAPTHAQIQIAAVGPLTGEYATFGQQMKAGLELAVADLNASGGLLGQKIVLNLGDDACDPKQAVSAANQMAAKKVKLVVGHYCSGSSIPASKVYGEEGILQISPASTNPDYTEKGGWNTFRVCGRDDQQGKVAGEYMASHFADRRIAILHDNSTYGKGLAEQTRKAMNGAGVTEAMFAVYTPQEKDYLALVSRMKLAGITVMYIGGNHTEAGLIIRQAKGQGMDAILVGGDALVNTEFWQVAGDAGAGTMMTFAPDPRRNNSAAAVVKVLRDQSSEAGGYVLYSYAAVQVWAAAVRKANTVDPRKVAAALKADGNWPSVLGPVTFDHKGDPTGTGYVMYVWRDGAYRQM